MRLKGRFFFYTKVSQYYNTLMSYIEFKLNSYVKRIVTTLATIRKLLLWGKIE